MKNDKKDRKGTIITIGEDKRKRIPQVFDTIFKMERTPVSDEDNPDKDETFNLHTLRTIDVEGVVAVPGKKAVNVNGEFDINLEDDDDDNDFSPNKVWADKSEAITAWEYLTDLEVKRAEKLQKKVEQIVNTLRTSQEERQY